MSHVCLLFTYTAHKNYKRYTVLKSEKKHTRLVYADKSGLGNYRASNLLPKCAQLFPFLFNFQNAVSDICSREAGKKKRIEYITPLP